MFCWQNFVVTMILFLNIRIRKTCLKAKMRAEKHYVKPSKRMMLIQRNYIVVLKSRHGETN